MIGKILLKDIKRNKTTTISIFLFAIISSMFIIIGVKMIFTLNNSLSALFSKSIIPHFAQYHSGELDEEKIKIWTNKQPEIDKYQIQKLLNIESSKIYFNQRNSQANTVMEILFVKQNQKFDFLLNLNNEIINLKEGEIAVPIYYKQKEKLKKGDILTINLGRYEKSFIIKNFVRDVQMNPAIVSSKRFLMNESDFRLLEKRVKNIEFLISFRLINSDDLSEFSRKYSLAKLPQKGPTVDFELIRLLNSITDGLIAGIIMIISVLINLITLLSLRFLLILSIEEDYRQIGMMKAIGIPLAEIKKMYLSKYLMIIFSGNIIGYYLSILMENIFFRNIFLYIGEFRFDYKITLILISILIINDIFVILFCSRVLKKIDKSSTVELLSFQTNMNSNKLFRKFELNKFNKLNIYVFLGLKDIFLRSKQYFILLLVFSISILIITIPINFLNTMISPDFITYMGMGKSDFIFSLRQSDNSEIEFEDIIKELKADSEINKFKATVTSKFDIINNENYKESIFVETGDAARFPVRYSKGSAPLLANEIAISYLLSNDLNKEIGDEIKLIIDGKEQLFLISGIYQDITNGGKTAKANIAADMDTVSWYTINVNTVEKNLDIIKDKYELKFNNLKVHNRSTYFGETFGHIIKQLKILSNISSILVILITSLIISLFLKIILAKEMNQIIVKKSLGISVSEIKKEYLFKALLVFFIAIIIGSFLSNIIGESILSLALSIFGASKIELKINYIYSYLIVPVFLMILLSGLTLFNLRDINKFNFKKINEE